MAVIELESLPLGFRFHPTDEELINHYLKRKIDGRIGSDAVSVIPEVDVCRCEPWDLPDRSVIRSADPEWFFFSPRDRKYSNGSRHNRATEAGYWKATGKDRLIKSRCALIGMKKTLVFYRGRAPHAARTHWIMHEYRTTEPEFDSGAQGGFVLCRLFKKPEEKIQSPNTDEVESSGFSHTPTRSSPSDAHHGTDSMEEFATPRNQELPATKLQENSQPLPVTGDNQPAYIHSLLADEPDCSTTPCPLKQEQSHSNCNMASDEGDCDAELVGTEVSPLLDDLSYFLGPESEQLGSIDFPYMGSPLLHTSFQCDDCFDHGSSMGLFLDADTEQNFATEFVGEDDFNELLNIQKDLDIEPVMSQGLLRPHESMQQNVSPLKESTGPLNFIRNGPSQNMYNGKEKFPSQGNIIRTDIKIRARQPPYLNSSSSGAQQGAAIKRLRLQRSIRLRSASAMGMKSSSIKDSRKVAMTEARERAEHRVAEEREVSDDAAASMEMKATLSGKEVECVLRSRRTTTTGDTGSELKGRPLHPETSRAGSAYVVGVTMVLLVILLVMCWTTVVPKLVTIR